MTLDGGGIPTTNVSFDIACRPGYFGIIRQDFGWPRARGSQLDESRIKASDCSVDGGLHQG
jgi:hypothetical protein